MSITTIQKDYLSLGRIRYFYSDRCVNNEALKAFNQWNILADELVTFDCGLMDMEETENPQTRAGEKDKQVLAVIIRPEIEPNYRLEAKENFEFCGYDLVDISCHISAIPNCGAGFEKAIDYRALNQYGLIETYRQAVHTQLELNDQYPEESHAYCEIVEIWRRLPD